MLILASQSPRRQELLRAAGIAFRVVVPAVEERLSAAGGGRYADLVRRAALAKASAVTRRERGLVLAADTIVVCEGEVLGKPADEGEARRMLRKLSGRWHRVYTGVALVKGSRRVVDYERTEVAFRRLSKKQIDWYVSTGEPMDKAGSYAIQGTGAALIRAVRGCYTNVIGLPLPKVLELLAEFERDLPAGPPRGGGRR
ncbi:MAG TPA: Maf family protein [Armatimonadota bacterium]|nr:Maf family protein [Armatimonadota bacterium]